VAAPAVSFRGIHKRFGAVMANDAVSFDVQAGSVHVLLGENGAGKTTLLSILTGFLTADAGEILVDGRALELGSPRAALRSGIGLCAQHFMLAGALTGAENVLLGRPGCAGARGLPRERVQRIERLAASHGLDVPLDRPVDQLTVVEQERLEILKLLERDCRVLVLDEPTSVLAPPEVRPLFATLRRLAAEGRTIILVTHRLAEVQEVADRVTVLRRGRVVGESTRERLDTAELVRWIAGEETPAAVRRRSVTPGVDLLEVRGLTCGQTATSPRGIDLDVRAGEIVGVGGVLGNGQTEIVEALTGRIPIRAGSVRIGRRTVTGPGRMTLPDSVAWVPEDRRAEGLALEMTLEENLWIGVSPEKRARGDRARRVIESYDVRPADPLLLAAHLSGGNQQRLLLAREMSRGAALLLAVHPTRGLDPGATHFVHERLLDARDSGLGILLVTGDLSELYRLSDRILILFRGQVRYRASANATDREAVNRALVGVES
jgi:general nucleoside transport system ATP-binding protein